MRNWMPAWAIGTMLAGAPVLAAAEAQESPARLTVVIHVTDNANLSPTDLAGAQTHATLAYRAAGFDIVWSSAPWKPEAGQGTDPLSIDVRLVIVPADMAEKKSREENLDDSVLGIAVSGATEARGRVAYVFYHRIERIAIAHQAPIMRGLGHVMAHEVGHVLMGVNSHGGEGLMRSNWNPRQSRPQTFTRNQVQQIRRRFMGTPVPPAPREAKVAPIS
jgi:hypothetical protein